MDSGLRWVQRQQPSHLARALGTIQLYQNPGWESMLGRRRQVRLEGCGNLEKTTPGAGFNDP
jgi:hypothetical protein